MFSPFLFILSMEGLHVMIEDVVAYNYFRGVRVDNMDFRLSHLFYVDDIVFLSDWASDQVDGISPFL